jgi:hypothetical protein
MPMAATVSSAYGATAAAISDGAGLRALGWRWPRLPRQGQVHLQVEDLQDRVRVHHQGKSDRGASGQADSGGREAAQRKDGERRRHSLCR